MPDPLQNVLGLPESRPANYLPHSEHFVFLSDYQVSHQHSGQYIPLQHRVFRHSGCSGLLPAQYCLFLPLIGSPVQTIYRRRLRSPAWQYILFLLPISEMYIYFAEHPSGVPCTLMPKDENSSYALSLFVQKVPQLPVWYCILLTGCRPLPYIRESDPANHQTDNYLYRSILFS